MDNRLNVGEIEIELDGRTVVLKPTFGAATNVNRFFGNFNNAVTRVASLDLEATAFVIAEGLSLKDRDAKGMPERVYKTGLQVLATPVIRFIGVLSNGGKPVIEEDVGEQDPPRGG